MRQLWKSFSPAPLAAVAALLASSPVQADTFACETSGFVRGAIVLAAQSTTSTEFVDVSGAAIDIGVVEDGCIQVEVSFQASTINPYAGKLRVLVDDVPIAPAFVMFDTLASRFDNRTVTFVKSTNAEGLRTVKLQFASAEGFPVTISKVLVIVRHDPLLM